MSDQMSTSGVAETEPTVKVTAAPSRKKSSTAVKLIQAAALATVLVPLGSIAVETSSCSFYAGSGFFNNTSCLSGPEGGALFHFGSAPYVAELRFDQINVDPNADPADFFIVDINNIERTEAELLARFLQFPGHVPVPIDPDNVNGKQYVEFQVSAPAPGPTTWESSGTGGPGTAVGYNLFFYWQADTNGLFPNPQVLHDIGGSIDDQFDTNMTILGSYSPFPPPSCVFDTEVGCDNDPSVGGRDDMFLGFTLTDSTSTVPEPATMVLLGTGLGGLLYRRRRRSQNAETPPSL